MRRLSTKTIDVLADIISGGGQGRQDTLSPYRSGPDIVSFFNDTCGFGLTYQSFGSRQPETKGNLETANGSPLMKQVLEAAVHPGHFLGSGKDVEPAVAHLNKFLVYEGYELRKRGNNTYQLIDTTHSSVRMKGKPSVVEALDRAYLQEQLDKCDEKLSNGDFDGAITNARTMLETIILAIEESLTGNVPDQEGDLTKYYKRVQKLLNLDPSQMINGKPMPESLRMILGGLATSIQGIASTRNKMSDAHARTFKPERHHAQLAVNSAKTVADFLLSSYEYQKARTPSVPMMGETN